MFRLAALLLAAVALTPAQTTVIELADGQLLVGWISNSSFRICRAWGDRKCATKQATSKELVKAARTDTESQLRLSSEYVSLEIDKKDGGLRVSDSKQKVLLEDTQAAARTGQEISVVRTAWPGESFYGLGVRADAKADARGQVIESTTPFLYSTRGYGVYQVSDGRYVFDMAASAQDRYRITARLAQTFEYYFYFGPGFKDVLEEHMLVGQPQGYATLGMLDGAAVPEGAALLPSPAEGSWQSLGEAVRSLVHASSSGITSPAFDLAPYRRGPVQLYRRASQLASISPLAVDSASGPFDAQKGRVRYALAEWRRRLVPFLMAYVDEVGYRGFPILHPLPFQYPNDTEVPKFADQFMVGDELLAAPIYTESNRRSVYFPMGSWMDLWTNKVYPGRQRMDIEAPPDRIPLFLRNGSILPLENEEPGGPMELHYTPKLAAEFFLYEADISRYSQVHASPALDLMRLEIDSRKTRSYQWVVHHTTAPREVRTGETILTEVKDRRRLRPDAWFYDRDLENLHMVVNAPADQVRITHLAF